MRVQGRSAGSFAEQRLEIEPTPNAANDQSECKEFNNRCVTEKAERMKKIRVFKDTIGFLVTADWLKQATSLFGLIFAPCMRPRFTNQTESNKF